MLCPSASVQWAVTPRSFDWSSSSVCELKVQSGARFLTVAVKVSMVDRLSWGSPGLSLAVTVMVRTSQRVPRQRQGAAAHRLRHFARNRGTGRVGQGVVVGIAAVGRQVHRQVVIHPQGLGRNVAAHRRSVRHRHREDLLLPSGRRHWPSPSPSRSPFDNTGEGHHRSIDRNASPWPYPKRLPCTPESSSSGSLK